jgi:hypothetical protein
VKICCKKRAWEEDERNVYVLAEYLSNSCWDTVGVNSLDWWRRRLVAGVGEV